ncbi:MAG: DUF86 domain-containing protein [Dethiobacter sp.]|jgi:uncharacterized protein YutE (UPF0331/DUF86 family)|nr:DUF86 domain-containing protein [Dethiobacter sp.]MCL4463083.1 DUF86 domain-containing protein [Bacillota bacterium]MCL5994037.1 DUF86 domain-containing protein [Bacillota bacterium]
MVNKEVIRQKIQFIEGNLEKLAILKEMSPLEFGSDFRNIETAKHLLQVSIEAILDISNHIIARNRWGTPVKSADSIRTLREKGYFTKAEEDVFGGMIKFRNRIVHLYHHVDEKEVYRILRENMQDFNLFLKAITKNNL